MEQSSKSQSLWPSVLAMGALVWLAAVLFFLVTQATMEFFKWGLPFTLLLVGGLAFFLVPATLLVAAIASFLHKRMRYPTWVRGKLFLSIGITALLCAVVLAVLESKPKSRLMRITSEAASKAANVQVTGFNSFLARRWLFAFDVTKAEFIKMADSMKLESADDIDLKASLEQPYGLMGVETDLARDVPGKDASLAYSRTVTQGQAGEWITMVYSETRKRAWLYYGFQN